MTTEKKRGFAAMDPKKQREISSRGGKIAHAKGVAHTFTHEEASYAGTKGGMKVSADRAHMAEIGRKGGTNSRSGKKRSSQEVLSV